MLPDPLLAFVRQAYRSEHARLIERHRNPHLDHTCAAPQYEVQAECHPEHQVVELATVEYAPSGDQCLVAITTCGDFAVWMD
jgi:hypothetical protein